MFLSPNSSLGLSLWSLVVSLSKLFLYLSCGTVTQHAKRSCDSGYTFFSTSSTGTGTSTFISQNFHSVSVLCVHTWYGSFIGYPCRTQHIGLFNDELAHTIQDRPADILLCLYLHFWALYVHLFQLLLHLNKFYSGISEILNAQALNCNFPWLVYSSCFRLGKIVKTRLVFPKIAALFGLGLIGVWGDLSSLLF